jgi:hypothetical protein
MPDDRQNVLLVMSDQHSYSYQGWRGADDGCEPVSTPIRVASR